MSMKQREMIHSVKKQIAFLNNKIDNKILAGRSYMLDAHRHKVLLARLAKLEAEMRAQPSRSFFMFDFPARVSSR